MESLSILFSYSPPPPLQNHRKTLKSTTTAASNSNSRPNNLPILKIAPLCISTTLNLLSSLPCFASETLTSTTTSEVPNKIDLESVLVSIDDFLNKNPFFVAGCTFIWLFVIPLTQRYFRKYKFISAIDGFTKLKENEEVQLLDIRENRSVVALRSPNLEALNKSVVQVEFLKDDEDGFVKNVLEKFPDPESTVLCIMDNFDGNSLRAAELLFKSGFKEAYALRGGARGKKGWLAIQETLLPPAVHMSPKKKKKKSKVSNGGVVPQTNVKTDIASSVDPCTVESQRLDNGKVPNSINSKVHVQTSCHSPYPNYPDLKPPSPPTPLKP